MAFVIKDRVKETSTTTGTGTITLAGASAGFQSFSAIGNGNTTFYAITDNTAWEVGIGTYTLSGNTLSRDVVFESSNANALVNFSAGTKTVFISQPALDAVTRYSSAGQAMARSGKDANNIFTTVEYKRADETLISRSVLSGGTSPEYTTRTLTLYALDGTTVLATYVFTLTYTDGDLTSENLA